MTNTGLAFTKTSISSSTPKSKHESDVDDASHGQVFVNAPLSINLDPERDAERGAVSNCVLDWSYHGREKRKLEEAGMVFDQSQITDYFSVMNEIEHLLSENSRLASLLHCSTSNTGSEKNSCTGLSTSSFTAVL